jgi:hypothetical protein
VMFNYVHELASAGDSRERERERERGKP